MLKPAVSKRSKEPRLFDYFVGAGKEQVRDGEAERLGHLEVEDQLDLRGLLDRQIGGPFAVKNRPVNTPT